MKIIFNIAIILFSIHSFGQVVIGDNNNASSNMEKVLLDFERTNNRGILLPAVNSISSITENGTLVLDASNPTLAEFKIKLKNSDSWFVFSRANGDARSITNNRPASNDYATAKVVLGANTSTADGALVLESKTQAMVLPIVNSIDNIVNPSPGMMVFLRKNQCTSATTSNPCIDDYLAFYNGTEWSFWSASYLAISIDPPIGECDIFDDPTCEGYLGF